MRFTGLFRIFILFAGLAICSGALAAGKPVLVRGQVEKLDPLAMTVVVRQDDNSQVELSFDRALSTVWLGYEDVDFETLDIGQVVDVEYIEESEASRRINWIEIYEKTTTG